MDTKNFWESKIFWAMVFQFLASFLVGLQEFLKNKDFSPEAIVGLILAAVIIVIRIYFTDQPIKNNFRVGAKQINEKLEDAEQLEK